MEIQTQPTERLIKTYHIKSKKVSENNKNGRFKVFAWVDFYKGTFLSLRFHESFAGYPVAIAKIRQQIPSSEELWKANLKGNKILNFADNPLWCVHQSKAKSNKVVNTDTERLQIFCNGFKHHFKTDYKPAFNDAKKLNECKFWDKKLVHAYLYACKAHKSKCWYLSLGIVSDFVQKETLILKFIHEDKQSKVNPYNFPDFDMSIRNFKPDTAYYNGIKDQQKRQAYRDFCRKKGWELRKVLRAAGGVSLNFCRIKNQNKTNQLVKQLAAKMKV